jgi:hypothetical protein
MAIQVEREAVGLNGQTLLRVQRNGPKIHSQYNIGFGDFGWAQCEVSKGQAQSPSPKSKEGRRIPLYFMARQPLQSNGQVLSIFDLFYENKIKIDSFSTIVWVFILVQPKLPSRVHRLGKKVLPCRHFGERWPLDFSLYCEGSRGWIIGFLQSNWWTSTAS